MHHGGIKKKTSDSTSYKPECRTVGQHQYDGAEDRSNKIARPKSADHTTHGDMMDDL